MLSMTLIFFGFTYIPRLLTMNPKNFPAETSKAHFVGFNFILKSLRIWNALARWSTWSSALIDFTNMSSMYTSMDVPI